jgi:hypothetical protein
MSMSLADVFARRREEARLYQAGYVRVAFSFVSVVEIIRACGGHVEMLPSGIFILPGSFDLDALRALAKVVCGCSATRSCTSVAAVDRLAIVLREEALRAEAPEDA